MRASDLSLSIIIILIFVVLYVFNILVVGIKKIQADWAVYRCNPLVMPMASVFGHDPIENFTHCIQTMQTNYMSYLLQPLNYNINVMGNTTSSLSASINSARAFFNNLRNSITDMIQSIFGVFLNILIEVQRLTINIKDMIAKTIGVLATLLFTLDGAMKTMQSAWASPPGQLVRALCFSPETKLQLLDGTIVMMKDIKLNSTLKNGATICAIMKISNVDANYKQIETVYKVKGGEKNEDILVSGSHLIYSPHHSKFVHVEHLPCAIKTDIKCDEFTCLITSAHTIPIGNWIFHDWEDNNGSPAKTI